MINAIICRVIKKWKYCSILSRNLENNEEISTALGFETGKKTPSQSCFTRFIQIVGKHRCKNVDEELARVLEEKKIIRKNVFVMKTKSKHVKRTKSHKINYTSLTELPSEIELIDKQNKEFEQEIPNNGWYLIFTDLVSQLLSLGIIDGKYICLDATHVNTSKKDPNQSYGIKKTEKLADGTIKIIKDFFGYKLHIAVDAKTNLPVGITITTGCVADNKEAPKIIRQLKHHSIFFKFFLADGGYNDKKIYREIKQYDKDAKFICPLAKKEDDSQNKIKYYYDEKTKEQYEIHHNTENGRKLFRMRGPTENINKIIKCDLNIDKPRVKGIKAIESMAYISCIAILILAIAAKLTNREHLTNKFSRVI